MEAGQLMRFDAELAERVRYARGLTVPDFATYIESIRERETDAISDNTLRIREAFKSIVKPEMSDAIATQYVNTELRKENEYHVDLSYADIIRAVQW